ncbi:MAG: hypothetical protein QM504_03980 [Pseudomonadota bacterium]
MKIIISLIFVLSIIVGYNLLSHQHSLYLNELHNLQQKKSFFKKLYFTRLPSLPKIDSYKGPSIESYLTEKKLRWQPYPLTSIEFMDAYIKYHKQIMTHLNKLFPDAINDDNFMAQVSAVAIEHQVKLKVIKEITRNKVFYQINSYSLELRAKSKLDIHQVLQSINEIKRIKSWEPIKFIPQNSYQTSQSALIKITVYQYIPESLPSVKNKTITSVCHLSEAKLWLSSYQEKIRKLKNEITTLCQQQQQNPQLNQRYLDLLNSSYAKKIALKLNIITSLDHFTVLKI